jgi:hypothetical protein
VSNAQHNQRTSRNLQSGVITHGAALELDKVISEAPGGDGVVFYALRNDDQIYQ